jgi:hypothetical protein
MYFAASSAYPTLTLIQFDPPEGKRTAASRAISDRFHRSAGPVRWRCERRSTLGAFQMPAQDWDRLLHNRNLFVFLAQVNTTR